FDKFQLQSNVREVKLKHIAKGGFEDCIKSKKLNILFRFLIDNEISLHYSTLNFLYFSTVDIIDSLITSTEIYYDQNVNRALKNELYVLIKNRKDIFIPFLYEFEYPNIKKERVTDFINTFQKL